MTVRFVDTVSHRVVSDYYCNGQLVMLRTVTKSLDYCTGFMVKSTLDTIMIIRERKGGSEREKGGGEREKGDRERERVERCWGER